MRIFRQIIAACCFAALCFAQEEASRQQQTELAAEATAPSRPAPDLTPPGGKRIAGVLPNYRTADISQENTTLDRGRKIYIARKDAFDFPLVGISAVLAGIAQAGHASPSFGQGLKGYGHRLLTTYADQVIGNTFTEGLFPVLLHEDPRYFRRGEGNGWYRAWYAASRVFVTHKDGGKPRFNYSEWIGNSAAVAISTSYYPDGRTASDAALKLLQQCGTDAASQILKEFWPDIKRKFTKNPPAVP